MAGLFDPSGKRAFRLFESSQGWDDTLPLSPHLSIWASAYGVEAGVLAEALARLAPALAFVGSAAVPGLASRPIIDIALGVDSPQAVLQDLDRLKNCGYVLAETPTEGARLALARRLRGVRTHTVLVVERDSAQWQRMLRLRDRLIADAGLREEYGWIKNTTAARFPVDRAAYRAAKAEFINRNVPE